ncbi:MAG: glycosyltransferase family 4 protein [Vicinamibacterales bacterium]
MRIVLLSHFANYWTAPYATHLASAGHDVLAVGFDDGTIPGIRTATIGRQPWERHKYGYVTRALAFGRLARDFRADVVVATYVVSNGLTAALGWRGPLVVSAHGYDLLVAASYHGPVGWMRRRLAAAVCRRAAVLHVVSDEMAAEARRLGVATDRIAVIPVGIDPSRFAPGLPEPRALPRIVCTRRHERVYDNETIIDAFARLRAKGVPFEATLVGAGPLTRDYAARIDRHRLDDIVTLAPAVTTDAMPSLLHDADIYVSASLVDGTSSALLEAMAVGLLPVVTDIPANAAWIDEGRNGLRFPAGGVDELADALERACLDSELRARARAVNRAVVLARADRRTCLERLEAAVRRAPALHRGSQQPP